MKKPSQYNITDIAQELGVTRQTVYYWIKKSWITPKRDYRNYPVFTKEDLNHIRKWQNALFVNTPAPSTRKSNTKPQPAFKWRDFQSLLCK